MKSSLVSVRDYLRLIFRRKWALVLPAVAGLLLVPLLWLSVPPKYRAPALVRRKDLAVLRSTPSSLINKSSANVPVSALRVEILTWKNLERVIRQTNMDTGLQTPKQWQDMYAKLRGAISIDARARGRGIDLIEIAAVHNEPELAAKIANAVADNYVETTQKASRSDSRAAVQFLKDGTDEYRRKLREAEANLGKYKQTHFSDLPDVKDSILSSLLSLRTEKTTQQLELTKAKSRLEELNRQLADVPKTIKGEVVSEENPVAVEVKNQLLARRRLLTSLKVKFTDEHPDVKRIQREIQELEQQVEETPARIDGTEREVANPEYQELQMRKRELAQDIRAHAAALSEIGSRGEANRQQLRQMAAEEKRYNDLQRDREEAAELYAQYRRSLVSARTRLEVETGRYGTEAEMAARALIPTSPYRLERIKLGLAAVVGGLALGVALMFGFEFADRSFRSMEDASTYLDVPVLASIPRIVSPQEAARKRRRRLQAAGAVLLLILMAVVGAVLAEHFYAGMLKQKMLEVFSKFRAVSTSITGSP